MCSLRSKIVFPENQNCIPEEQSLLFLESQDCVPGRQLLTSVPGRIVVFTRMRELFSTLTRIVDCTRMRIVPCTLMRVQSTIISTDFLVISLSCRNPFFPDKEIILQKMNKQAGLSRTPPNKETSWTGTRSVTPEIKVEFGFCSKLICHYPTLNPTQCNPG